MGNMLERVSLISSCNLPHHFIFVIIYVHLWSLAVYNVKGANRDYLHSRFNGVLRQILCLNVNMDN